MLFLDLESWNVGLCSTGNGLGFVEVGANLGNCFTLAVVPFLGSQRCDFRRYRCGPFLFRWNCFIEFPKRLNADHHHAMNWVSGLDSLLFLVSVRATVEFRGIGSRRGISRIDGFWPDVER